MKVSPRLPHWIRPLISTAALVAVAAIAIGCNNGGSACGDACARAFDECQSVFDQAGVPPGSSERVCSECCNDNADEPLVEALVECLNDDSNSCQDCVSIAQQLDFDEC